MNTRRPIFLLLLVLTSLSKICIGAITINSVHVTASTCPNNGTATIFASSTSDSAVFLYNIISGPVLYPLQNDSIFKSLYPGTYTARVHDVNSYDSAQTTFTITGNYQQLAVTATSIAPLCTGESDGEIIVNPGTTGLAPYTWQITYPYTGTAQNTDTLHNLATGTYIVKVTDACDNAVTQGVVVDTGGSGFEFTNEEIFFLGCDTVLLQLNYSLNSSDANLPLKFSFTTSAGTFVKEELPQLTSLGPGYGYYILDTLAHVSFDSYLKICVTDTCHITYCVPQDTTDPFAFSLQFYEVDDNCVQGFGSSFFFDNSNLTRYLFTDPTLPLTLTITNTNTNTVVDSFTDFHPCNNCIPPLTGGQTYRFKVTDNCGDFYQETVVWPTTSPATFQSGVNYGGSCIDSAGNYQFNWSGFGSALTIELLSGPASVHSTKSGFAYYDTIIYPIVFTNVANTGIYFIDDLPPGTYNFRAFDSCGNTYNGSFLVNYISDLQKIPTVTRQCGALNSLYLFLGNQIEEYEVRLLRNGIVIDSLYKTSGLSASATFNSLSPGLYIAQITYPYNQVSILPGNESNCWSGADTINITPVNDSILGATDVATCNGVIYIHVDADTNNGVPPFKYEIISGPETFPPQVSNLFTVNSFGTYVVGVVDSCGDVDARQISVDTGRFDPVVHSGGWCQGSYAQLEEVASPFFTYTWKEPDGNLFTGDTLVINPFTDADTGIYLVTKIVTINGCRDSAYGSYHLVFKDTFQQSVTLCTGDTLYVGSHIHTTTGVFTDTLTGVDGCDSIEISTLTLFSSGQAAIMPPDPPICHTGATTLIATGGTSYTWNPGNYHTDTITVNPAITTVYTVLASNNSACSATASVTVYPAMDSVTLTTNKSIFCVGDSAQLCATAGFNSYQWSADASGTGDCVYAKQAGDYYVVATDSNGCTVTSNHLSISVYPVPSVSIIVEGDTLSSFDAVSYQWYFDDKPIPDATKPVYIATEAGNYSLEITDTSGCTELSQPVSITGVIDLTEAHVLIYPNPSSGSWQLIMDNNLLGSNAEVFDEQGQIVFQSTISNPRSEINLNVAKGMYWLRISNTNVNVVRKLVKL